ncbi:MULTISPECIES: hypothetical protein [Vibrio]|uniref:hypothetical protein n=1 Tax=Vibrio TaxID=662 RepID=UPI00114CF0B9|nr:hypothetical protein [Vibrio parahaemolyticus]EGQ8946931.1 hypothetical protein [Vibrio parahaemolyticus]EGR1597798.1 hypothetical protein [Vibrio parahaemolyticus]EGR1761744.1 hypothetical protein [Vibrio parahaemolyticus]EGR3007716.1 hypothetical protein [Vibrio parahaemolyticus]EGR3145330.1 hypothetical protein [Vibrio parahaemolyticus]
MEQWHIIGNGPGDAVIRAREKVVRFNQTFIDDGSASLTITNTKLAGLEKGFLFAGQMPHEDFIECFEVNSSELEKQLGCVPSLGLVTIKTLLNLEFEPRVSCMSLLPSLKRAKTLYQRKPLPEAYHNWLGERSLVLFWLDNLDWPEFLLKAPHQNKLSQNSHCDYFSLLQQLPNLPKEEARRLWQNLSQVGYRTWLEQANQSNLKVIESLFYLSRTSQNSPNWWMYDNQISICVDRLQKVLAFVQQSSVLAKQAKV